jgi:HPt (histidine-containing phosphotransfer) domain-containing protein
VREVREDPEAPERERRISALLETEPIPSLAPPRLKAAVAETHAAIRRTAKALRKRAYHGRGLLHTDSEDVFAMSVSAANRDRALLILDGVIDAAREAGGKVVASPKTKRPLLELRGESFELSVREPTHRAERELTQLEITKQRRGELHWIPNQYLFIPTGKMSLEIRAEGGYSPLLTITDGRTAIETRLDTVVPMLIQKAAHLTVDRQMREEERERERIEQEERERFIAGRNAQLERLAHIEKKVARWHRAAKLRAYADSLPSEAAEEAAWIRNAAEWLDPIVDEHWPEVDVYVDDKLNDIDAR